MVVTIVVSSMIKMGGVYRYHGACLTPAVPDATGCMCIICGCGWWGGPYIAIAPYGAGVGYAAPKYGGAGICICISIGLKPGPVGVAENMYDGGAVYIG